MIYVIGAMVYAKHCTQIHPDYYRFKAGNGTKIHRILYHRQDGMHKWLAWIFIPSIEKYYGCGTYDVDASDEHYRVLLRYAMDVSSDNNLDGQYDEFTVWFINKNSKYVSFENNGKPLASYQDNTLRFK